STTRSSQPKSTSAGSGSFCVTSFAGSGGSSRRRPRRRLLPTAERRLSVPQDGSAREVGDLRHAAGPKCSGVCSRELHRLGPSAGSAGHLATRHALSISTGHHGGVGSNVLAVGDRGREYAALAVAAAHVPRKWLRDASGEYETLSSPESGEW